MSSGPDLEGLTPFLHPLFFNVVTDACSHGFLLSWSRVYTNRNVSPSMEEKRRNRIDKEERTYLSINLHSDEGTILESFGEAKREKKAHQLD